MTIYHLYCITNLVNNKKYIGQTTRENPMDRWAEHEKEVKSTSKRSNTILYNAMRKHGVSNFTFEPIACCLDVDSLNKTEELLIKQHKSHISEGGYNIRWGGKNKIISEYTRKKISKSNTGKRTGKNNHFYGRKHSEETKQLIRNKNSGVNAPLWGRKGKEHPSYGRKLSETQYKAIHEYRKKHPITGDKNPMFGIRGTDTPAYKKCSYTILIVFSNGTQLSVKGIRKFCKENNYDMKAIQWLIEGKSSKVKDIIHVRYIDETLHLQALKKKIFNQFTRFSRYVVRRKRTSKPIIFTNHLEFINNIQELPK